jgi:hypothetical protein
MLREPGKGILMNILMSEASREHSWADGMCRHLTRIGLRALMAAAVATAFVGLGVWPCPSRPAWAGDDDKSTSSAAQASRQKFIREMRRTLKEEDDRLIVLVKQVLEEPDAPGRLSDQILNTRITVKSAEASYLNAKLKREVAEIAVKEYTDGVYLQDKATVDGEIAQARKDLERAHILVDVAKERQADIKAVADGRTAYGRMINYDLSDRVDLAVLKVASYELALQNAESKKKVLDEYTKLKRTSELKADVKKTYSDELAKQAMWELEQMKLEKMQKALKTPWPASSIGKRLLELVDRAVPIEEQAHAKLEQLAKATDSGELLQKEIRELTNELGAIIEEAEAARAASDFARLWSGLRRATRR